MERRNGEMGRDDECDSTTPIYHTIIYGGVLIHHPGCIAVLHWDSSISCQKEFSYQINLL